MRKTIPPHLQITYAAIVGMFEVSSVFIDLEDLNEITGKSLDQCLQDIIQLSLIHAIALDDFYSVTCVLNA